MSENVVASVIGGLLSGLRHYEKGFMMALKFTVTGILLAHYTSIEITNYIFTIYTVKIDPTAIAFLIACWGPEIVDTCLHLIKSFNVVMRWKD